MIYMPQVGRRTEKMKKVYGKEEGVSPVIATILMVAITVVLAATVYIMVAGLGPGSNSPLSAGLNYIASSSDAYHATLQVSLSNPSSVDFNKVKITIKNGTSTGTAQLGSDGSGSITIGSMTYSISVLDLDGNGKLSTGDQIVISSTTGKVGGVTVLLYVTGYSGNAQVDIPS